MKVGCRRGVCNLFCFGKGLSSLICFEFCFFAPQHLRNAGDGLRAWFD